MRSRLLIVVIASLLIGVSTLTRGQEWGDDFASYTMQASSILNGTTREFVEHNSFTIFESSNQIGPVAYPWGYPLILTPAYAIKGINPLALKLVGLFFFAGFLICLFFLMIKHFTQIESLLLVSLFAFNPLLLKFLDQILSDIPFLFFSTLSLLLMAKDRQGKTRDHILIGFAIACAFFIRATGILMLVSFFVLECYRAWVDKIDFQKIKMAARNVFIVAGTFGLLWIVYALLFPGGGESYFVQYRDFQIQTALGFIYQYFQVFSLFFGEGTIWKVLYYTLFIFFAFGVWKRWRDDPLFIIFFSIWMILLVTWPSWQGPRFIFPLLPIFIYFTFQGMKFLVGKLPKNHAQAGQWIFYSFWLLIIGIFLFNSSVAAYTNLQNERAINGPFDSYSKEVYKYIKEETPSESIVVFFKPRAMRLMTDRDTIMSTECDRILKGDYLVLSRKVGKNQQIPPEEIGACNLPLNEVLRNTRFIVYQIQK